MVANQRARDHRAAVLAERDAAVLAARPRVLPLPVARGEVLETCVSGPQADGHSLRVLRSERAGIALLDVYQHELQGEETQSLPNRHAVASRTQSW